MKDFAELICVMTHEQLPETTSTERSISKRGNKIYLDYLQNRKGQTIAAAYSLRPYPGVTASAPLKWEEIKSGLTPAQFTIYTLPAKVQKTGDLFKGILGKGINIETCLQKIALKVTVRSKKPNNKNGQSDSYARQGVFYRDLEEIMEERGVKVDHAMPYLPRLNKMAVNSAPNPASCQASGDFCSIFRIRYNG